MSAVRNELMVMNSIADTMMPLSKEEQRRVLNWLEDYFGIYDEEMLPVDSDVVVIEPTGAEYIEDEVADEEEVAAAEPEILTLPAFFEQVAPKTAIQKIVTAAYWLDTEEGKATWKSFEVNKLLKSLDIKVSSVSGTLAIEAKKDDPMIVVLDKSSDSMQGRKTFRLSEAGFAFVENRLD